MGDVMSKIVDGHPWSVGFGSPDSAQRGEDAALMSDLPKDKQKHVEDWILYNIEPIKTPNRKHSSYHIKHILERDIGIYLTNNQFKDAMMNMGYSPVNVSDLNWYFCISERSHAFNR